MEIYETRWHGKNNLIKIYKGENRMKFTFSFSHTLSLSLSLSSPSSHHSPLPLLVASCREARRARAQGRRRTRARVGVCGLTQCGFRTIFWPSGVRFTQFSNHWIREDESYVYRPITGHSSVWTQAQTTLGNER